MQKSRIAYVIVILVVFGAAFLLTRPFGRVDEPDPIAAVPPPQVITIGDSLDTMDDATRSKYNLQVATMQDQVIPVQEAMPSQPTAVHQGEFAQRAHAVQGIAKIATVSGQQLLRFENFKTDYGPDLRVYLSPALNNSDVIDLGPLKGSEGNFNYQIPEGTATQKYSKVLVWCRAFGVLFSYAEVK
jgi:hypothetical protein